MYIYLKKSLECMFFFFSLLYKALLNKKQKVLNVKACDKPIIFNNLPNKFSICFKCSFLYK